MEPARAITLHDGDKLGSSKHETFIIHKIFVYFGSCSTDSNSDSNGAQMDVPTGGQDKPKTAWGRHVP
jgi:hypothetical protein